MKLSEFLSNHRLVGYDIETVGDEPHFALEPFRVRQGKARISSAAFVSADGEVIYAELWPSSDALQRVFDKLIDEGAVIVGWNLIFDLAFTLAARVRISPHVTLLDAQIARRMLENDNIDHERGWWGLKKTVEREFPSAAGYEKGVIFDAVDETLLRYNIADARLTAQLGERYLERLLNDPARIVTTLIRSRASLPFARAWLEGVPLDREHIERAITEIEDELTRGLAEAGLERTVLRSPKQLLSLFNAQGVAVTSTDKRQLSRVDHPLAHAVRQLRYKANAISRILEPALQALGYTKTGAAHPSVRLWNTYTGRVGYSSHEETTVGKRRVQVPLGPPLHQINRDSRLRNIVAAPDGYIIVEFDFNAQESRLLAHFAQDPTLLRIFRSGLDFHAYMGARIAGEDYAAFVAKLEAGDAKAKEYRQLGKVANLSLAYRTSAATLREVAYNNFGVSLTEQEASRIHTIFRTTYSKVVTYWQRQVRLARTQGFVESIGHAPCHLHYDGDERRAWANDQTAINYPIQASGADLKFAALSFVFDYVENLGGRFLMDLHDALFFILPARTPKDIEVVSRALMNKMNELDYNALCGWRLSIPMPVEGKVGRKWGEVKTI